MVGEALSLFDRPVLLDVAPRPRIVGRFDGYGLRPYQIAASEAVLRELATEPSTLLLMHCGAGKTQTFGAIAAVWSGRVLVLAHRDELIDQAVKRLRAMTRESVGREQAFDWAEGERIVVASVQTMVNARRRERFKAAPFSLIVVDEAHHTTAKSYRKILETFPAAKVLGVTATPDRGDGTALGDIYSTVAYERDIETGIGDGYLVPVCVRQVILEEVNLSAVKTTAGDLNLGQLDEEMAKAQKAIARKCFEECGDRKTILFYTKVESAHDLASVFNDPEMLASAGRPEGVVARAVDGETPTDERKEILEGHARGDFQFLINVGIATEGYDSPGVSCVAVARPTKSRALYTQMAGRGLRVLPGLVETISEAPGRQAAIAASAKPDCLLLDFVGASGKHKLIHPLDVLGGKFPDEEVERAKKLLAEKKMGAGDAMTAARAQLETERVARAEALRALQLAKLKARTVEVDPFRHTAGERDESALPADRTPRSQAQVGMLERFGLQLHQVPRTSAEAQKLIGKLIARRKAGLCTWKQSQLLNSKGIPAERVSFANASRVIEAIIANNWHPLPAAQVDAILNAPREPGSEG